MNLKISPSANTKFADLRALAESHGDRLVTDRNGGFRIESAITIRPGECDMCKRWDSKLIDGECDTCRQVYHGGA